MMKQLISSYVESPYVAAVVILWGNVDTKPPTPADLMSNPRVPIVVIKVKTKLLAYRTTTVSPEMILISIALYIYCVCVGVWLGEWCSKTHQA